ncbi:MAG: hypothetical protein MH112_07095 [Phenylobacterium sp.]|uniref:hypothetical protein n=1 Tax=Phenylobacterium sp. TaxID=1871053 RepID=UPI0025CC3816|nr:hypothetical protein [Phenylobacterium sp.]MCG9916107.1 hypothetical protein [Phenylobacterium sp.]
MVAALVLGAAPRDASAAAAVFPPWWDAPRALAAADQAGAVTGVGAYPFVIITTLDPTRSAALSDGQTLAAALRARGAWLVVDPGLAGPCVSPT